MPFARSNCPKSSSGSASHPQVVLFSFQPVFGDLVSLSYLLLSCWLLLVISLAGLLGEVLGVPVEDVLCHFDCRLDELHSIFLSTSSILSISLIPP